MNLPFQLIRLRLIRNPGVFPIPQSSRHSTASIQTDKSRQNVEVKSKKRAKKEKDGDDPKFRDLEAVIGLEVHAQIASKSKLFSGSSTQYGERINSNVSFLDAALPGTLPVLNRRCVEAAVLTSLALNCRLNLLSKFDRKHYFYADLPAGYQITQHRVPISQDGHIEYWVRDPADQFQPYKKRTRIMQIQLEQDSGKSLHDAANNRTLIDLNRAGVGLMELVMEPNLINGLEAYCLTEELASILTSLGTCACHMEKGDLRVDANISVRKLGGPLGIRTEVKNLNSFRFVSLAIEYEIERQKTLVAKGEPVENETRTFDFRTGRTLSMRDKEVRQDYRHMPEPNLPPLRLVDSSSDAGNVGDAGFVNVEHLRRQLPTLPSVRRDKWIELGVPAKQAITITKEPGFGPYFETCLSMLKGQWIPEFADLMVNELRMILRDEDRTLDQCSLSPEIGVELMRMFIDQKITWSTLKQVLTNAVKAETPIRPLEFVTEGNLWRIRDEKELEKICDTVISSNDQLTKEAKRGKEKAMKALIKQCVLSVQRRAMAEDLEPVLRRKLK